MKTKIRLWIEAKPLLAQLIFPAVVLKGQLVHLLRYGVADPRSYFIFNDKGLAYLVNSKVAQTAITNTCGNLVKKEYSGLQDGEFGSYTRKLDSDTYLFTFVRNPFARIYSCYRSKLITDKTTYDKAYGDFDFYLLGYLKKDQGFAEFVYRATKIPNWLADRHIKSQYYLLYSDNTHPVDYVGRFENLAEDFTPIRERFGLEELPHMNASGASDDWRDQYTPELVEVVYKYYKEDCDTWYPNAKQELLTYLESNSNKHD